MKTSLLLGTPRTILSSMLCASLLQLAPASASAQTSTPGQPPGCSNPNDVGKTCKSCEGGNVTSQWYPSDVPCPTTPNSVNAASADVQRVIPDISAFGSVGELGLQWTRYSHSRLISGARYFGDGHTWRHSYQWDIASAGTGKLKITEPDGSTYNYTLSAGVWTSIGSNTTKLTQSGTNYYLLGDNGTTFHFQQFGTGSGIYYLMVDYTDSTGHIYTLTYDANRRLVLVTEPAGRWLRVTYQAIQVNQSNFTALATITSNPTDAVWTQLPVTNTTAYRYLRYYSSDPDQPESFCNVSEVEFYNAAGTKLTGTPFGSSPSYQNKTDRTFDKATDGNTATYFDYAFSHFGFTGIDLGAAGASAVSYVRFFPRATLAARMNKGRFEGSNTAPVSETVISKVEAGYGSGAGAVVTRTVNYNYTSQNDTVLQTAWLNLSGATYGDGTQATYTYRVEWAGQRPLLETVNDPRVAGAATRIKYQYWENAYVYGALYAELDATTGQILAKLEGVGANNYTNMGRKYTYANGATFTANFGGDNIVNSMTDSLGRTASFTHDTTGSGFLTASTDSLNHTTTYVRDAQGRLLGVTLPDGTTKAWTRDTLGLVLTEKDELGRVTTFTRNAQHRVTRLDYPDGGFETYTYNSFGQVLDHRMRNGGVEHSAYDARGLLTSRTDALGNVSAYTYNAQDLPATMMDALGHATGYAYNERGQVTQTTFADASTQSLAYDAYGNRIAATDELGHVNTATYDAFHRRLTSTDALNRTTTFAYDELPGGGCCGGGGTGSHLTTLTTADGKVTKFGYDAEWQKTSVTTGYGTADTATTTYTYDAGGRVIVTADARGKLWLTSWDVRNRAIASTDPLGNATITNYDAVGNVLAVTRPDGGVTTKTYDAMNRNISVADPAGQTTQFAYGGTGFGTIGDSLVRLTDARGNAYGFTYDLAGRKTSMFYPGGSHEDTAYDGVGNVTTFTTRAGQVKTCAYDFRNRDLSCTWSDTTPAVTKTYDAAGRLLTMTSSVSSLSYSYDDASQFLSETQDINAPVNLPAKTVSYTYNAGGNRTGITYPDGTVIATTYTGRNQIKDISANGPPPLVSYAYDAAGNRITKTLENGIATTYTLDNAGRLTALEHRKGAASLQRFDYTLSAVGNRTGRTESNKGVARSDVYGYDATDQLTQVKYNYNAGAATQDRQVNYAFDAVGNRVTVTDNGTATPYTANALNQYTAIDSLAAPAYDANGNLTTQQAVIGAPLWSYTYDAQNRLTGGTSSAGGAFSFAYDARNRCVARTVNGAVSALTYEGWNLIDEWDAAGTLQKTHIHGANVDEVLATLRPAQPTPVFHHHDGLGSVTALTDNAGNLLERYTYDVYGTAAIQDGTGAALTASSVGNRFLFTGREWLAELSLYDYRNRVYSQDMGRFLQIDPIRFGAGDGNLYRYVSNRSPQLSDPSGQNPAAIVWGGAEVGGAVGGPPGAVVGGAIGAIAAGIVYLCFKEEIDCAAVKAGCIAQCTATLPTREFGGGKFFRCMRDCMTDAGCP